MKEITFKVHLKEDVYPRTPMSQQALEISRFIQDDDASETRTLAYRILQNGFDFVNEDGVRIFVSPYIISNVNLEGDIK